MRWGLYFFRTSLFGVSLLSIGIKKPLPRSSEQENGSLIDPKPTTYYLETLSVKSASRLELFTNKACAI